MKSQTSNIQDNDLPIPFAVCPNVPELAILCSSRALAEKLIRRSEQFSVERTANFELLGIVKVDSFSKVSICSPVFGAPLAAALIEHLKAGGVKQIVYIGSCGAIKGSSQNLQIGDICIPKFIRAEDGTSRLYRLPKRFELNSSFHEDFSSKISVDCKTKQITLFSTDAPYLETKAKVEELQRLGVDAIELEFAACCALGAHHGIDISGVFIVSDMLDQPWTSGFRSKEFQSSSKATLQAVSRLAFN